MKAATRVIAVVDIGKTTAKLALVEPETGVTRASVTRPNRVLPGPPYPHADVEGVWTFMLAGLRGFAAGPAVAGIAVTTHGATAALMAEAGLALPVLDYEFSGPEETAPAYDAARPDFAETLSPRLPNGLNVGAQVFWQAHAFPAAFARVRAILGYPQYWTWRLTGVWASEVTSLGCHTDLWAPAEGRLSSLVVRQGWAGLFPPVRSAGTVLGPLLPEIAAETGLPPETPVVCGIHDFNASLLPWLERLEAPFSVISSGTWTIVMTVGGALGALDPRRDSLANVDAFGRPVPTARFMGGREYPAIAGPDPAPAGPEALDAVLKAGVFAVPPIVAGVGPFPKGTGGIEGPVEALPPGGRTALADLYLALVTCKSLALSGGPGNPIIVEGPLARNVLYCRLLASFTGRAVHPSPDATGTLLGAARLLGLGAASSGGLPPAVAPLDAAGLRAYAAAWRERARQALG